MQKLPRLVSYAVKRLKHPEHIFVLALQLSRRSNGYQTLKVVGSNPTLVNVFSVLVSAISLLTDSDGIIMELT